MRMIGRVSNLKHASGCVGFSDADWGGDHDDWKSTSSTVNLSQNLGQPLSNCNKRFLECFLYRKMSSITY